LKIPNRTEPCVPVVGTLKERETISQLGPVRHVCALTVVAKVSDTNRHNTNFLGKKVNKWISGLRMPNYLKGDRFHESKVIIDESARALAAFSNPCGS
jgi:hypothetical protein